MSLEVNLYIQTHTYGTISSNLFTSQIFKIKYNLVMKRHLKSMFLFRVLTIYPLDSHWENISCLWVLPDLRSRDLWSTYETLSPTEMASQIFCQWCACGFLSSTLIFSRNPQTISCCNWSRKSLVVRQPMRVSNDQTHVKEVDKSC